MHGDFHVEGYDIEGLLGAGPAGEVWLAREQSSGSQFALKRVRPRDAEAQDEARRIVSVLETVAHPHLLRIKEMLPDGGELVFALTYADGGSLGQLLLARGTLDPGEVVGMAAAMAEALAALHEQGLVHGDVTPENVLFSADARPLLADAGLLALVEGGESGTLGYTDPSAEPGAPPAAAGDVYGLAAVCYAALAGAPPEPGASHRPLHQVAPGVPSGVSHVVEAGLQGTPGQRPAAAQFAAQLAAACPAVPVRFPHGLPGGGDPAFPEGLNRPDGGSRAEQDPFVIGTPSASGEGQQPPRRNEPTAGPQRPGPPPQPTPAVFPTALEPTHRPAPATDEEDDDAPRRRRGPLVAALVAVPVGVAAVAVIGVLGWQALGDPSPGPEETTAAPTSSSSPSSSPSASAGAGSAGTPGPSSSPRTPAEARWTKVLTALDQRRARAWRTWDRELLRTVYKPGSTALQEELSLMDLHASKDVTSVVDLNTPVLSLDVVSERPDEVVVDAVSQLQPYSLVIGDHPYPHAGGEPRRFRMTLEPDGGGGWLIAASTEVEGSR